MRLIFIDSPASSASFWVNFERRYALRIGKEVLAFEPDRRTFSSHAARVGNCVAMLWNASIPEDHKLAHDIARWLHMERRVYTERLLQAPYEETYLGEYVVYSTPSTEYGEDEYSLRAKIREYGASVVVMVSNRTLLREWPFTYAGSILYHVEHGSMRKKPHVEYVWLERPSLPDLNRNPEKAPGAQTLFGDAVLRSAQSATCLVAAEDGTINWNRIDDLLIRLEHAAFERGLQDGPDREGIVRGRMLHQSYRRL